MEFPNQREDGVKSGNSFGAPKERPQTSRKPKKKVLNIQVQQINNFST